MTETEMKWFRLGKLLRRNLMAVKGEQWEVLYEGTVETTGTEESTGYATSSRVHIIDNHIGEQVRLTINGESRVYTVTDLGNENAAAGNVFLAGGGVDDGFGLCVIDYSGLLITSIWTRTPGTYHVKIERKVAKMYSYNGVVLPKLPEWDREKYPYAFIGLNEYNGQHWYSCYVSEYKVEFYENGVGLGRDNPQHNMPTYKASDLVWVDFGTTAMMYGGTFKTVPVWSNFDMLNYSDGSVYLKATDPIPVYE